MEEMTHDGGNSRPKNDLSFEIELPELEETSQPGLTAADETSDPSLRIELDLGDLPELSSIAVTDDEKTDPSIMLPLPPRTPKKVEPAPAPPKPKAASIAIPKLQNHSKPKPVTAPSPAASPVKAQTAAPPVSQPRPLTVAPATITAPAPASAVTVKMPELGPLDPLMKDPDISEVMVNDLRNVMIEKSGKLQYAGFAIPSLDELNRLVRNILDFTGRFLTPETPYVDTTLPDGSRVNIVGPPITVGGPSVTIRKHPARAFTAEALIRTETLDQRFADFLKFSVQGHRNILISGGTGSGKTTLLNLLLNFVPENERLVLIEDTPELVTRHANSVKVQTKPQTPTAPAITARELLANALRMRPDRVIVGECRRGEAFDMLQAMNTGHEGSMTTIHANSPRDALSRLETLCMMSGIEIPLLAIRRQIESAIDLIVQIKRFRNGKRRIIAMTEITGIEGETITLQDIFAYDDARGFHFTGYVPTYIERLREMGLEFPQSYFS